ILKIAEKRSVMAPNDTAVDGVEEQLTGRKALLGEAAHGGNARGDDERHEQEKRDDADHREREQTGPQESEDAARRLAFHMPHRVERVLKLDERAARTEHEKDD